MTMWKVKWMFKFICTAEMTETGGRKVIIFFYVVLFWVENYFVSGTPGSWQCFFSYSNSLLFLWCKAANRGLIMMILHDLFGWSFVSLECEMKNTRLNGNLMCFVWEKRGCNQILIYNLVNISPAGVTRYLNSNMTVGRSNAWGPAAARTHLGRDSF